MLDMIQGYENNGFLKFKGCLKGLNDSWSLQDIFELVNLAIWLFLYENLSL